MEGLLGNTQTLLGVVATLAILCLFVEIKKEDNGEKESDNFIFRLISSIGSDVLKNLSKFAGKIRKRADNKKIEVYERCGLLSKSLDKPVESYLIDLCKSKARNDLHQSLLKCLGKLESINRKILNYSQINNTIDSKDNKSNIIKYYNYRQEPQVISLLVFLVAMLFLLTDVFSVNNNWIIPFTWFYLLNIFAFSVMLWINHFSHCYNFTPALPKRNLWIKILCGLLNIVIPSSVFCLLLYLPFDKLSILLSIGCFVIIVLLTCVPMFNKYWQKHEYSKTIVLKHIVYFCISALYGVFLIYYLTANYPETTYITHIQFFYNSSIVRYILFIVLLLDLILIPFYGGYLHMKIDEWIIIRRTKKNLSLYYKQLDDTVEELQDIIQDIIA